METYCAELANLDLECYNKLEQARKKLLIDSADSPYMTVQDSMTHLYYDALKTNLSEKAFFEKLEQSELEKSQSRTLRKTLMQIFDIGSFGLPLLLGYDKKLSMQSFIEQFSKIKDITLHAEWEASSNRKEQ
ncbi:unnamed protein product [Hanseniaspora opuntiae]